MLGVIVVAAPLVASTSLIHDEALSVLSRRRPRTEQPRRVLVLVLVPVALMGLFVAHAVEIALYGSGDMLLAR